MWYDFYKRGQNLDFMNPCLHCLLRDKCTTDTE